MNLLLRDDRADWVKVLEIMYEGQMTIDDGALEKQGGWGGFGAAFGNLIQGSSRLENIENNTDLSEEEIKEVIDYLDEANLLTKYSIEADETTSGTVAVSITSKKLVNFGLTQEGLRLAHRIKTERQRRKTNLLLVFLTFILVVLTIGLLL